jgi:hypothetical protein
MLITLFVPCFALAQMSETVTINPGYTNQTFYSMQNGTVSSVINTDWDLAFQISGFDAAILINSKNNVKLFQANKDASEWSTITTADTAGMEALELLNNDAHIFNGAFNITNDASNMFDLGWGVYDLGSHAVLGDSLYFIKLNNGAVKKLWIETLANSIYTFRYADLDGSNEQQRQLYKQNYTGKNFGYYSIQNDMFYDREPLKYAWDLCFQQYVDHIINYKVSGVLTNDSVQTIKAYPVDVAAATDAGYSYSFENNLIGYNWKTFNGVSFDVDDSTVYFVIDRSGGHKWKIVFTGFGGSANGNFYFDKYDLGTVGLSEIKPIEMLGTFPNPAQDVLRLVFQSVSVQTVSLSILDMTGKLKIMNKIQTNAGIQSFDVPVETLSQGMYILSLETKQGPENLKFIKQ